MGENFCEFRGFGEIRESFNHANFQEYGGVIVNVRVIILDNGESVRIMDDASLSLARQYLSNSGFPSRHVDIVASMNGRHFIAL